MSSGWSGLRKSLSYTGARTLTDDEVKVWDRLCADSTIASKFPMYVMPVSEVLKLNEFQPHEELKDRLVEWKPGMGKVLFCSHTWLKYKHPDDDAKSKIKMLQRILIKIRDNSRPSVICPFGALTTTPSRSRSTTCTATLPMAMCGLT